MPEKPIPVAADELELLDEQALGLGEVARCCRVTTEWIALHVQAGVLQPHAGAHAAEWRFASSTLVRARRIAELEHIYDADPQLAALTVDLMEEVARLRRRLQEP